MTTAIFIFHRDFRVVDNTALTRLAKVATRIFPIFVFTPDQIDPKRNSYYNSNSVQFMCESLEELRAVTSDCLTFFYGDLITVLNRIHAALKGDIQYVGFNLDYTKYARDRTAQVEKWAKRKGVETVTAEDYTLVEMNAVRDGNMYSVFKPYYDRVKSMKVEVSRTRVTKFWKPKVSSLVSDLSRFYTPNDLVQVGGRIEALRILKGLSTLRSYARTRNDPSVPTTTLSAHIKFGTVSIREVYEKFRKVSDELTRQLVWHDFYAQIMYYLPYRKTLGGGNFQDKKVRWTTSDKLFRAWCEGRTGFPIVDAGMRQLNTIGWMHNRVRLVTSNFLSLVLGIDWRKGERYFAKKLVDYDPSSNNGNWQFSAQVGIDRVPYVRIYNPFSQAKDVDPECKYIQAWVPELRKLDRKQILGWESATPQLSQTVGYPLPIVNYSEQRKVNERKYKR